MSISLTELLALVIVALAIPVSLIVTPICIGIVRGFKSYRAYVRRQRALDAWLVRR